MCPESRERIERLHFCGRIISWTNFRSRYGWSLTFRNRPDRVRGVSTVINL